MLYTIEFLINIWIILYRIDKMTDLVVKCYNFFILIEIISAKHNSVNIHWAPFCMNIILNNFNIKMQIISYYHSVIKIIFSLVECFQKITWKPFNNI